MVSRPTLSFVESTVILWKQSCELVVVTRQEIPVFLLLPPHPSSPARVSSSKAGPHPSREVCYLYVTQSTDSLWFTVDLLSQDTFCSRISEERMELRNSTWIFVLLLASRVKLQCSQHCVFVSMLEGSSIRRIGSTELVGEIWQVPRAQHSGRKQVVWTPVWGPKTSQAFP